MKILIIGHATHGKGETCKILNTLFGFSFISSSFAAAELFMYDELKDKYGYKTFWDCYNDRVNHRAEWHDKICEYNKDDKARLAKDILSKYDIYDGMRSNLEVEESINQNLFDWIIGVYDPRKTLEDQSSFDIDLWEKSNFVIPNSGTLPDLEKRIKKLKPVFI